MLNKSKGNMYPWVTHTWNVIKGKCPHDCSYCYMKRWGEQPELHFDEKELKTDLGEGRTIFVGSSCDMWAKDIEPLWICKILSYCNIFKNRYLFQTKNPARFEGWLFPDDVILGTTIESNRCSNTSKAPCPMFRHEAMCKITLPKMVSIEPIMDFDLDEMIQWMREINPLFVSIGADSGHHHLPEPPPDKLQALIDSLKSFTQVKLKDNLGRLLK